MGSCGWNRLLQQIWRHSDFYSSITPSAETFRPLKKSLKSDYRQCSLLFITDICTNDKYQKDGKEIKLKGCRDISLDSGLNQSTISQTNETEGNNSRGAAPLQGGRAAIETLREQCRSSSMCLEGDAWLALCTGNCFVWESIYWCGDWRNSHFNTLYRIHNDAGGYILYKRETQSQHPVLMV